MTEVPYIKTYCVCTYSKMTKQQIFKAKFIAKVMLKVRSKNKILFQKESKFIQIKD